MFINNFYLPICYKQMCRLLYNSMRWIDGRKYIKLSGYPGVRNYLNTTRYLANNPQIVSFGVGTLGIEAGIAQGARFGIVFSAAYIPNRFQVAVRRQVNASPGA
ncbi:hypothetical protein EAE89_04280 [Photorhabdus heterorhabditis]|nr:hypothetical protein [Photorhabdus heterorhabditis]